ncbi:F-actin-monooxygenase MICAL3 isoform X14, partial [Paramuricea clavata]
MAENGDFTDAKAIDEAKLKPDALFDSFIAASNFLETLDVFSKLCASVNIETNDYQNVFGLLKERLTSWKCQSLWNKLDKRAELLTYKTRDKKKPCAKNNVLIIGCGPCGLRFAIEAALLGAKVVVLEKRNSFSRNNVLHLWPFLIVDLKNLGAKKFFGKFCAGTLDHISIRRLQLILLKVSLILGVQVYAECLFVKLREPSEDRGWTAEVKPENHVVSKFQFDVIIGTDGRRHTLKGFKRKEFRGKLAIAITMNFINRNTKADARVEEISGVAYIFNQGFFQDLKEATGIDLENIVYYKDETHYFVMTAKKKSLLLKGVLKKDLSDPRDLLAQQNVNRDNLLNYAREAADFCTSKQLPHLDFAVNPQNNEDIAMFDFTSMYAAENAAMIFEMKGHRLLTCLAGDSLMEPFWPTGSGCARGFLSVFDAAWMMRGWGLGQRPIDLIMEREGVYKLLAQTTSDNVSKNYDGYTIDPKSRYPPASVRKALKDAVKHLYKVVQNSLEESLVEEIQPDNMETQQPVNLKNKVSPDLLLSWCQKHTKGYKNVNIRDMSASWKNGLGFCALIHKFRPDLVDFERLNEDDVEQNNELAFSVAENELGIPPQISAVEMANNQRTDMLTIVTYLAQYYDAFKDEKPATPRHSVSSDEVTSPDNKHRSPLSKLSVISRISMRTKKEKRKHKEETPADKSSKKYKVSEENKAKQSGSGVSLTSYRKGSNTGAPGSKIQISDKVEDKPSSRISALAQQVFGVQPDQNQQAKSTAGTPIRHTRGSLGDSEHCHFCNERIFVFERLSAEGFFFHRKCFKCEHCELTLRLGNYGYVPPEDGQPGRFYCKAHYRKVFYETPGKSPRDKERKDDTLPSVYQARRSHSIGNIDMSMQQQIEKPIDFETTEVQSPPRKVLKVPKNLREEINARSPPRTSTLSSEHNVSVSPFEIISLSEISGEEKSEEVEKGSEKAGKQRVSPMTRGSANRKAVNHKYSKLEARPVRRSSISAARKSDKGTRRLFLHKRKPDEKKEAKKGTGAEIVSPPEPPPKPPRAHEVADNVPAVEESGKGKRRRNSKRAMYPESMAFSDSFLITKAVDISLDDNVSPAGDHGNVTNDLRACLGEATPKRVGRQSSSAGKRRDADPKKHWSEYYRAAMTTDDSVDEDTRPTSQPEPLGPIEVPPEPSPQELQVPLPTLHEDREMSPTSPKKHRWPNIFGGHHKKDKKGKDEKKRLKEEHKKEKKEKRRRKKGKKGQEGDQKDVDSPDAVLSETDEPLSPEQSDVGSPDSYYDSSEEEDLPEAIRLARAREKRFQLAEKERDAMRQKKNQEYYIKLEMRERQRKRLRIAQSIQRELGECEVRQMELEKLGIIVEKKMAQVGS